MPQLVAELMCELLKFAWLGFALYFLRALLVAGYATIAVPIGGPAVDASVLQWFPFFLADFPWSLFFDSAKYASSSRALSIYVFIVGIPWIIYGIAIHHGMRWIQRRINA